jgi:hypothetical protein
VTYGCIGVLYVFAFLSAAVGFCIVIFAKLAVSICVALAPLALACLLFNSSRWLFDGWLKQTANYILLMVVMAIMTKFITGLQEASMDGIMGSIGDASNFVQMEDTYAVLNTDLMIVATVACCAIYIVGTIFFFQAPSIASGIAGGASSGGHGFLQTGMNMAANRLMFRRLAANTPALVEPPRLAAPSLDLLPGAADRSPLMNLGNIAEKTDGDSMKRLTIVALGALALADAPGLTSSPLRYATASIAAPPISTARFCRHSLSRCPHRKVEADSPWWLHRQPRPHLMSPARRRCRRRQHQPPTPARNPPRLRSEAP